MRERCRFNFLYNSDFITLSVPLFLFFSRYLFHSFALESKGEKEIATEGNKRERHRESYNEKEERHRHRDRERENDEQGR